MIIWTNSRTSLEDRYLNFELYHYYLQTQNSTDWVTNSSKRDLNSQLSLVGVSVLLTYPIGNVYDNIRNAVDGLTTNMGKLVISRYLNRANSPKHAPNSQLSLVGVTTLNPSPVTCHKYRYFSTRACTQLKTLNFCEFTEPTQYNSHTEQHSRGFLENMN
ncbi:hypothetical protein M422DRAFT_270473 [Sphaerobolus stellatus SS14]|uniref:Uncharacterized protein n=1 Tax=Sphaerobolus stellatus (strain SS14) TaxID=990650 RepID=A0A0C9UGY6_SPHS4|nr:hypothetical protein M422DRAFT_270473 [Sphaerobolus stellatus SS14]